MIKVFEYAGRLTSGMAWLISAIFMVLAAVTYLAAAPAIAIIAPILAWAVAGCGLAVVVVTSAAVGIDRCQRIALGLVEFWRDFEVAKNDIERDNDKLIFEGQVMAATAKQVESGLLHAGNFGGVGLAAFPRQVVNQIEAKGVVDMVKQELPTKVDLGQLIPAGPNLDALVIGLEVADQTLRPVSSPLSGLVHVGIGGSSGWGKTVFLQSLALQIALAPQAVELAFIDVEEQAFTPFSDMDKSRLRYPLAHNEADILAILDDLRGEWHRRRELFRKYPQVDNLISYNEASPVPLPPVVLMLDEVNMLTDNKDIVASLTKLGQGTRKYGIFCILAAQNWNADDIPTKLRNNLSSRFQMRAMSRSQSSVMLASGAAADITDQGRAYAVIPGRPMAEVQTPYISKTDIIRALSGLSGRSPIMPEASHSEPDATEQKAVAAFEALLDSNIKFSWRKATEAAYGSGKFGKGPNNKLRATLDKFGVDYPELQ